MLRYCDIGSIEFAVADNLNLRDAGYLLAHELEDRTPKIPGNALV
jgi:hypothetical protein